MPAVVVEDDGKKVTVRPFGHQKNDPRCRVPHGRVKPWRKGEHDKWG